MIPRLIRFGNKWLWLVIPCLGTLLATWRFWTPGITNHADMLMGIYRIFELQAGLLNGSLFPRMGPNLNFGYGAPLFQFYPPLASYLALPTYWAGFGFVNSSKFVFVLALLLAAIGAYLYANRLFRTTSAAILATILYTFAPYLLIAIYERGAAAESLALGILPWLLWSFHELLHQDDRKWIGISGVFVALLMLAHNITSLFFMPMLIFYVVIVVWGQRRFNSVTWAALAILFGIGLSAFYWLPAMLENRHTQMEAFMLSGRADVTANLLPSWQDWFQRQVFFDYWGEQRFRLAWWQLAIGLIGALTLYFAEARLRSVGSFFLVILIAVLFMQLQLSRTLWESAPLVRFLQFSWRLYGVAAFCSAIFGGYLIYVLHNRVGKGWSWVATGLISLIVITLSTYHLTPSKSPVWISHPEVLQIGSAGLSLPSPFIDVQSSPVEHVTDIRIAHFSPYVVKLEFTAGASFLLHVHRIYFPGWQVYLNGNPVDTFAGGPLGLVTAEIPPGDQEVEIRFGPTPLRRIANLWSALTLCLLGALYILESRPNLRIVGVGFIVLLLVLGIIYPLSLPGTAATPNHLHAKFGQELQLLGTNLERVQSPAGETLELDLYWFVQSRLPDLKIFLHLVSLDDTTRLAQFDSEPMLGYSPMSHWMPGEFIGDRYQMVLSEEIPPGDYLLLMGVYDLHTLENLSLHATDQSVAKVLPGDRLVLQQIKIERY
jgi:hypothetical protein